MRNRNAEDGVGRRGRRSFAASGETDVSSRAFRNHGEVGFNYFFNTLRTALENCFASESTSSEGFDALSRKKASS